MSLAVNPVSFTSNNNSRSKTEQAATGVGAAGATTAYASQVASKRGVFAQFSATGRNLNQLSKEANDALAAARKVKGFGGLGKLFNAKRLKFTADAMKFCDKFKNLKFIGKVMNNPITKKLGGAFGSTMAFFVLVPSVINMINVAAEVKNS